MSELKACPFCGGRDLEIIDPGNPWVICNSCESYGPSANNDDEAIAAWNRRADDNRGDV